MLFYDKLKKTGQRTSSLSGNAVKDRQRTSQGSNTSIKQCIEAEMARYFELLDGQPPNDLYRMVMSQVETTVIQYVMDECGNNQSRAAEYLGISRGTLRNKLNEQGLI